MALEAVVFQQDLFGQNSNSKELYNYNLLNGNWSSDHFVQQQQEDDDFKGGGSSLDYFLEDQTEIFHQGGDWTSSSPSMLPHHHFNDLHQMNPSPDSYNIGNGVTSTCADHQHLQPMDVAPTILPDSNGGNRARRRRSRSRKNKEEIENQRMTHIAVERNRRKQMNEYLSVLRSLMPESYVQRGDQASIIGGAINFVKELEQRLQSLGGHTDIKEIPDGDDLVPSPPFSEFFTFPQYSTSSSTARSENQPDGISETMSGSGTQSSGVADIEVTIVESHANLKIRSKRRPKQLLKLVSGLHTMRLNILHLNVTTADQIVLYSISVKVEDDCKLSSVDEIATALHQLLGRIQEESMMN